MGKLLRCALIMALVMAIAACGGDQASPTFEPLPTPTLPPDFVTFTDESHVFSIAYQPDWELALFLLSDLEDITKDLLRMKQYDLHLNKVGMLFVAGLPDLEGYLPNVNIVVESLPSEMSAAEFYEAGERPKEVLFTGYKVHSLTKVLVGNREAIVSDSEADTSVYEPGAKGKTRTIKLTTADGKVGWVVTCGVSIDLPPSTEDLQTCDAVVRSFRILQ